MDKRKNRTNKAWVVSVALLVAACTPSEDASSDAELDADVDAAADARPPTPPPSCTPATCGDESEPPTWGCPSACDPGCGGDTVCCDDGTCLSREFDDCSEGCDVEPTLDFGLGRGAHSFGHIVLGRVCNRGTQSTDAAGWRVTLSAEDEDVCELELDRTLGSCECVVVQCGTGGLLTQANPTLTLRAELDVGEPLECGSPSGRVQEGEIAYAHAE